VIAASDRHECHDDDHVGAQGEGDTVPHLLGLLTR